VRERRTKIVATIGPASEGSACLRQLIDAGMNMARLSLAHGPVEETLTRIKRVRATAEAAGANVGILADLPGPKVRAAPFPEKGTYFVEGDLTELVAAGAGGGAGRAPGSDWRRIAVDHPSLLDDVEVGDRVALGDGLITFAVESVHADRVAARVVTGGNVRGRPGVVFPSSRATAATPTADDLRMLEAVVAAGVDAVAISFVRSPADVDVVRAAAGPDAPMLVAKIETQDAVDRMDDVIAAADAVMVARGDLGVRCALEDVPHYQKRIIHSTVAFGRPVITATQMLESMVQSPAPTRAEVSDVANAVFDGTSALMLSGETAIGHDPVNAVRTMARIAARAEEEFDYLGWGQALGRQQITETRGAPAKVRITAAISAAAWRAAAEAEATAIIACTNTGATARAISRFRPTVPVVAATPSLRTARQLSVAWGITPMLVETHATTDDIVWFAVKEAAERGFVKTDDVVAVLAGAPDEPVPTTDVLRLVRIH